MKSIFYHILKSDISLNLFDCITKIFLKVKSKGAEPAPLHMLPEAIKILLSRKNKVINIALINFIAILKTQIKLSHIIFRPSDSASVCSSWAIKLFIWCCRLHENENKREQFKSHKKCYLQTWNFFTILKRRRNFLGGRNCLSDASRILLLDCYKKDV